MPPTKTLPVCDCGLEAVKGEEKFARGSVDGDRMCQFRKGNCAKFFEGCVSKGATVCELEIDYVDEMYEVEVGGNHLFFETCTLEGRPPCTSCLGRRGNCLDIGYYECQARYWNGARWCNDVPNLFTNDPDYMQRLRENGCRDNDFATCTGCLGRAGRCNGRDYWTCEESFHLGAQWCGECMDNADERCFGCLDSHGNCQSDMPFAQCEQEFRWGTQWCGPTDDVRESFSWAKIYTWEHKTLQDCTFRGTDQANTGMTVEECQDLCGADEECQGITVFPLHHTCYTCTGRWVEDYHYPRDIWIKTFTAESAESESVAMKTETNDMVITTEDKLVYAFAALGLGSVLYGAAQFYCGKRAESTPTYDSV